MKARPILTRTLAAIVLATAACSAFALELGLDLKTSNLQLPWRPLSPVPNTVFPANLYFFGGEAWASAALGEDASFRLSYDADQVLHNSVIAAIQFDRGIARISVGPLIGLFNSDTSAFSAGLSTSVRLQWPGVAYLAMRSDGGTAISILQAGADPQARTELSAGFYVPHAIISGLVSAKRFNELDTAGSLVTDSLTRYALTIDVFKKNVPYTALTSIGYELRSKHYAATSITDSLGAIVMGLDLSAQISRGLKLKGSISSGAYVFGLDALKGRGPSNSSFLFSAVMGVAIDLDTMTFKTKGSAKKAQAESAATEAPTPEFPPIEPAPATTAAPLPADESGAANDATP